MYLKIISQIYIGEKNKVVLIQKHFFLDFLVVHIFFLLFSWSILRFLKKFGKAFVINDNSSLCVLIIFVNELEYTTKNRNYYLHFECLQ